VRVYLVLCPGREADIRAVVARFKATHGITILLLPLAPKLSPEAEIHLNSLNAFIVPLILHVVPTNWELPWNELLPRETGESDPIQIPPNSYCRIVTEISDEYVSKNEYTRIMSQTQDYDLFIDGTTLTPLRTLSGTRMKSRTTRLSPREFDILEEYILAKAPIKLKETRVGRKLGWTTAESVFKSCRKKIDRKVARYQWTVFRMAKGLTREDKGFCFTPPDSIRYCLIIPAPRDSRSKN
jgi:hypothetical protein